MRSFLGELKRRNVVRVGILYAIVGWLVLQIADVAVPAMGIAPWAVSLILLLVALGFPMALVMAWAYELTPEGIKPTHEVEPHESITPLTGRKLDFLIIGVLAAAVVFFIVKDYVLHPSAVGEGSARLGKGGAITIAVLPFADMSPSKDQEYLTDGISEELLNLLANESEFKVTGRTSSFAFKGHNEDLREIGRKLRVESVLEGSVRKQGDQLRITAQLVKTADGYHLWSETYDRKLNDVFAIQSEIASEVSSALKRTLLPAAANATTTSVTQRAPTDNVDAYTHYLRGQYLQRTRTAANLEQALIEFKRAAELDPKFARAHSGQAATLVLLANYGQRNPVDVKTDVFAALDRAAALDPALAEVYAVRALYLEVAGDSLPSERLALYERAVALNGSDSQLLMWLAAAYEGMARRDDEIRTYARAYALDPLMTVLLANYAISSWHVGDSATSNKLLAELESLAPGSTDLYFARGAIARLDGRITDRIRAAVASRRAHPDESFSYFDLIYGYLDLGDLKAASGFAKESLTADPANTFAQSMVAEMRLQSGDVHGALDDCRKSLAVHPDSTDLLTVHAEALERAGQNAEALELYLRIFPALERTPPEIDFYGSGFSASDVIYLLRQQGAQDRAEIIRKGLSDWTERYFRSEHARTTTPFLTIRARLAAATGDRAGVIGNLTSLYENSRVLSARFARDPLFEPYLKDPEFIDLQRKFDVRRAEWRQQLAAEGL